MSGLSTAPDELLGHQPPPPRHQPSQSIPEWNSGSGDLSQILPPVASLPVGVPTGRLGRSTPGQGNTPGVTEPVDEMDFTKFNAAIIVLLGILDKAGPNALDKAVESAKRKIPDYMSKFKITNGFRFLVFANDLLKWQPEENVQGKDIYDILCMFYFVLDQEPLLGLQTRIRPDSVYLPLTPLSSWIVVFAQLIGLFMDTPMSVTPRTLETFKNSPLYNYNEAIEPPGGFRTFNEFFSRHLKPGMRPISDPHNDKVICYPADCTYDNSLENQSIVEVNNSGEVLIKGLPWTIDILLQGSKFASEFHGGVWMHAFLNTYNYHRQHAPVSGKVIEAKNIQGAAYLEVNAKCQPIRKMVVTDEEKSQDPKCGPEAPDSPGYQFLQTRGCVVIENEHLGKVAVLPIGMAMVSGVKLTVREGDKIKKGDEISTFLFGGSDIICVFQKQAGLKVEDFIASPKDEFGNQTYSKYGTILAVAP
ncbi:phosphatidylserine decarboxylase [Colletotrichum truncatum]|uniref:Phosphatidylserine decarboxylase n=1 Tax=Colletotrichum truncatum TaxID=5467 RepID=A0ACC3YEL9_COLTU|nr:phosphatidylserine decarboxylase [Colletotrichum truncatum]KAF6783276.1 phosphatidylserine decarboxylase [Colletotrichum truncatum]